MTGDSGGGGRGRTAIAVIWGEIHTYYAVIFTFYPGGYVSSTRRVLREVADRSRRCSNLLCVPPPAREVLAVE